MQKILYFTLTLALFFGLAQPVEAIELHANDTLSFEGDETLNNAYIAGQDVAVRIPVTNDLVAAGDKVVIDSAIEGGLLAAANNLRIDGSVGRSARVAGNEITIRGDIGQDLVAFGNEVVIGSGALIKGDVAFIGSSLIINGEVDGTLLLNCQCNVTINGTVAKVEAEQVGKLTVGRNAVIEGVVQYSSRREADIDRDATVRGAIDYTPLTASQSATNNAGNALFFYGMISSLVLAFILLWLFRAVPESTIVALRHNFLLTFGLGIAVLVILPIVTFASFIVSVWLGLALLTLYALMLLLSIGLSQIILGWWLLQWWMGRTKQVYELDWRAAFIGVIATTILMLAQAIGWFIIFLMLLLALGGLTQGLWRLRQPITTVD